MIQRLTIGWLYHELMNTYGDRGNIIALTKRCEWRGIEVDVKRLDSGFTIHDLRECDLLFMGGAQDRQQKIVSDDLTKNKVKTLQEMIEDGIPGLYICGAYQFLGKYYKEADGTIIKGLNILDLHTEHPGENANRLIGNVVIRLCHPELARLAAKRVSGSSEDRDSDLRQNDNKSTLVGFENHGGRTYLGKDLKPLGTVLHGFGNNGKDKTEGVVYKNSFGTYLHGPILPKNPHFADVLIKCALEKKYLPVDATHQALQAGKKSIKLSPLNDSLEWRAHQAILQKLKVAQKIT